MLYFVPSCKSVNAINNMHRACSPLLGSVISSYWNHFSNHIWQLTRILFNPASQPVHYSCQFWGREGIQTLSSKWEQPCGTSERHTLANRPSICQELLRSLSLVQLRPAQGLQEGEIQQLRVLYLCFNKPMCKQKPDKTSATQVHQSSSKALCLFWLTHAPFNKWPLSISWVTNAPWTTADPGRSFPDYTAPGEMSLNIFNFLASVFPSSRQR